jgi:ATP-dependent helicase HrpB
MHLLATWDTIARESFSMSAPLTRLPIDDHLPRILKALEQHSSLLLQASPGSGKTTRVPVSLLKASWDQAPAEEPSRQEIWVLEPRRLAAKWAAVRVAAEYGEAVGETIGYQFRFETRESPRTRLRFLTEGVLLQKLKADPLLSRVRAVILDEFHERHLTTDLAFTCLRRLQCEKRPELRLVIMSATLDIQGLRALLPNAPEIVVEAPRFPVEIRHSSGPLSRRLEDEVAHGVQQLVNETPGDFLVFLPGMREILRAKQALESVPSRESLDILALHGELSREEQDRALVPSTRRKIVLATNVAESSLTIPGVTAVIDSGLHRQASHSHWSGIPALRTRPISKASAIQRSGRAGRTQPGIALRLYTRADFEGRAAFDTAEILRTDLAPVLLHLRALGISDHRGLPWIESPPQTQWDAASRLLWMLGFFVSPKSDSALKPVAERLASLSPHPRIIRLLETARSLSPEVFSAALGLAVGLTEGLLESRLPLEDRKKLEALTDSGFAERRLSELWRREFRMMASELPTSSLPRSPLSGSAPKIVSELPENGLAWSILKAFPDGVVRPLGQGTLVESASSGALELHPELRDPRLPERFVAVAIDAREQSGTSSLFTGNSRTGVRSSSPGSSRLPLGPSDRRTFPVIESWCPIPEDWLLELEPSLLEDLEFPTWDDTLKRVRWVSELAYGELTLSHEQRLPRTDQEWREAKRLLLKNTWRKELPDSELSIGTAGELVHHLRNQGESVLADALEQLLARLFLIQENGLLADRLPRWDDLFSSALTEKTSAAELQELAWQEELLRSLQELCPNARWEERTPQFVTLASGRRTRIQYRLGQEPWIESRLQDFIGMKQGPRILEGRLPLTLHLLAPNHRAVQVTRDLAGFWSRAYPELRTALMRRYPRHSWPEP